MENQKSWGMGLMQGMAGQAASGLLGAGLGMLTAGWQDRRQLKQQQKLQDMQIAGNKEMANFQHGLNLDMWKQTGPVGQKEQLKLAGLNPALMYGMGGGTGGSTQGGNGQVSGGTASGGSGEVQAMMGLMLQNQQIASQVEVNKAQANNLNAQADKTRGVDTAATQQQILNLQQGVKSEQAKQKLTEIETEIREIDAYIKEHTQNDVINNIYQDSKQATYEVEMLVRQNAIDKSLINEKIASLKAEYASAAIKNKLLVAQTANTQATTKLTYEQVNEIVQRMSLNIKNYYLNEMNAEANWRRANVAEKAQAWNEHINDMPESIKWAGDMIGDIVGKFKPRTSKTMKDGQSEKKGYYSEETTTTNY